MSNKPSSEEVELIVYRIMNAETLADATFILEEYIKLNKT